MTNRLRNSLPRCIATTTQGKRCAMVAARDGLCRYHHPALAVEMHKNNQGILPPPFNEQLEDANTPTEKVRLAMDVIASLTEQQAVTYHARLAGSSLGLFADRIFGA